MDWNKNDIVLITGGSKGLGKNLIDLFLKKQIKVINIDKEPLDNEDSKIYHYQCDLNDQNQLKSIIDIIKEKHGYPSIIINNAAIRHSNNLLELSSTEISSLLTINLISPISIYKSFIQFNSKRQYIITIASVLGFISPANLSIYSSTKAALISLHDSLTHELSSNGQIRTLLVVSGQLNTSLFKDINPPKQFIAPVIDSKKLADLIVEKIENGERGILYLPLFTLIVPLLKSLPNFLTEFIRWFSEMDTSV
ncbi:hypothetical protein WICMUC_002821 [Wickerhamomyces mucosus]|uniref:Uncharacterized protein n=1 Tax=Wickerhamomyces mucosus TaxID=1378264 RepID=A0A9P8PPF8_9ASCO|nr:hypothetical protein WICMUC_002821 [Wickerhamomyces mucosus]